MWAATSAALVGLILVWSWTDWQRTWVRCALLALGFVLLLAGGCGLATAVTSP